jgi:hypothetical protein
MSGKTTGTIHFRLVSLHLHSGITKVECPRDSDRTEFCWDFFCLPFFRSYFHKSPAHAGEKIMSSFKLYSSAWSDQKIVQ